MKIFVLYNSNQLGFPVLQNLHNSDQVVGVGIMERFYPHLTSDVVSLGIEEGKIHKLNKETWVEVLQTLLVELEVDSVFVLAFSWKVPKSLLELPPKGFVNFHFGLLPKYKGADPIFWQIKNNEKEGGLTVHFMSDAVDEGPVVMQEKIPFPGGLNYGIFSGQLAQNSGAWVDKLLIKLQGDKPEILTLEPAESAPFTTPSATDLRIDWGNQTALEIEALINAANPRYSGATTTFSGQVIHILEVTPIDGNDDMKGAPGEIVYSDMTYGPVVACINDEFVRVTVAQVAGSYISGVKLTTLGFFKGTSFV